MRRLVLIGRIDEAERRLAELDPAPLPPASRTAHAPLVVAGIAIRRLRTKAARAALAWAEREARHARIPALMAEVDSAFIVLNTPAARLIASGEERLLLLEEVEALLASSAFVVDGCRHVVRHDNKVVSLTRRPVLFALARALGEAWPGDVARDTLIARAFGSQFTDESHRARLASRSRAASHAAPDAGQRESHEAGVFAGAAPRLQGRRAGATSRRGTGGRARLPHRRRIVVELGPCAGAWNEPAHRSAGARFSCGLRQGAIGRSAGAFVAG